MWLGMKKSLLQYHCWPKRVYIRKRKSKITAVKMAWRYITWFALHINWAADSTTIKFNERYLLWNEREPRKLLLLFDRRLSLPLFLKSQASSSKGNDTRDHIEAFDSNDSWCETTQSFAVFERVRWFPLFNDSLTERLQCQEKPSAFNQRNREDFYVTSQSCLDKHSHVNESSKALQAIGYT